MLGLKEIQEILPQKYPFLLIDKIVEYEKNKSLTAIKNITGNEWATKRGEQATDVFPEALMVEAAAQAAIIFHSLNSGKKDNLFFLGKVEAEFLGQANVGDQLIIKVVSGKSMGAGGYPNIEVYVNQEKISNIQIFYSVKEK
ncbi:MAG: 3-hydroxyacyl-[acyl-carrier-protein] dehydratase FabZ [Candidatus Omnitrophica bacterium]|nr:3-hydroxyacyl-[acyl-carrier-protein] dehydratase FabZ [Candidatus Omnitrophota bacterium]